MTPRSFLLTPELADYVRACSEAPDEVAADLLAETAAMADRGEVPPTFQIAPEQGTFMQLLTRRARRPDGDRDRDLHRATRRSASPGGCPTTARCSAWTGARSGRRSPAGTGSGPAWPTGSSCAWATRTRRCGRCRPSPTFDLAFVDADKTGYADYVEQLYPRMTPNGLVLLDNTLRGGRVLAPETDDDRAVVELNAALAADPRWETVLLPVADGLTMLRKR